MCCLYQGYFYRLDCKKIKIFLIILGQHFKKFIFAVLTQHLRATTLVDAIYHRSVENGL
jgi:hypothetical protein